MFAIAAETISNIPLISIYFIYQQNKSMMFPPVEVSYSSFDSQTLALLDMLEPASLQ